MTLQTQLELAVALHQAGRLDEAEKLYAATLTIRPADFTARHLLGVIRFQQGRNYEALEAIASALNIDPNSAEAHSNLGLVLAALGRNSPALEHFDKALKLRVTFPEAHFNRGNVLRLMGNPSAALESYNSAIAQRTGYTEALSNRGQVLRDIKRAADALTSFECVLDFRPRDPVAWNNLGTALQDLHRIDAALTSYNHALTLNPDYIDALHNRGMLLHAFYEKYDLAIADFERLVSLAPDHAFSRGMLLHFRMQAGEWRFFDQEVSAVESQMRIGAAVIVPFAYQAISQSPADLMLCSEIYAANRYPNKTIEVKRPIARKRIRLGYLAGEFREHATAHLTAGLFEHHDRDNFEIFAFDAGYGDNSPMRQRLEASFDHFENISAISDSEAARIIEGLGIDVLINLNGYFGRERMGVFAQRPSPIQVNWLGFPATSGTDYIDYIIADGCVIPEGEERYYTERVIRLPDSYQSNDSRRIIGRSMTRSQCYLPEAAFVFAWFNQSYKLTPAMFASWMRILKAVDGSVLWLLQNNPLFVANLRGSAIAAGVAPERLIFAPTLELSVHLSRLSLADLFLDSLPYNAHTSASDALWAGLPLLTCRGTAFAGRVSASLLSALGVPELITDSIASYEALAINLAHTPARLKQIREKLERNRLTFPLFDTSRFTSKIEAAYRKMVEIAIAGAPPENFTI